MKHSSFTPEWPLPGRVKALQTTRLGGTSLGQYGGLNLAAHVDDDPLRVATNRRLLIEDASLPAEPCWLEQVHGTRIVDLDSRWQGPADGAVSGRRGQVCVVMTADCLPVLLADRQGRRVAAVHCGWRGLAAGILPAAVASLGSHPDEQLAWLGPAIGQAAFEVGDEVRAAFVERNGGFGAFFEQNERGRWQADLYAIARLDLARVGVHRVFGNPDCTFEQGDRYFSHRRAAPCGRMATLIWLD
jgi:YfiH family protein